MNIASMAYATGWCTYMELRDMNIDTMDMSCYNFKVGCDGTFNVVMNRIGSF
jgi:hypothetical protein